MEFKRMKARLWSDGPKKTWMTPDRQYRITYHDKYGLRHYHAVVLTERFDGNTLWNFVGRRGPYKTFKKAVESCERNKKLWDAFVALSHSDGGKQRRFESLSGRAGQIFWSIPVWVRKAAHPSLFELLCPTKDSSGQDDHTEASETSSPAEPGVKPRGKGSKTRTPAESATAAPKSTTPTILPTLSKETKVGDESPAPAVEAPAKAPAKAGKKTTTKSSASGKASSPAGAKKKRTVKRASASSRKRKG